MIKLQHNITKDFFERIYSEPMNSDIPSRIFERKEGENDIIERTITLTYISHTDTIKITCYRKIIKDKKECIQKYTFTIVEHEKMSGEFDDGYAHISVQGGLLQKTIISEPWPIEKGLEEIKEFGYNAAKSQYEMWMEHTEEEGEAISVIKNGLFDEERFCDELNEILWEVGFDEMREYPSLAKAVDFCGIHRTGYTFFDGVDQFIKEKTKSIGQHEW